MARTKVRILHEDSKENIEEFKKRIKDILNDMKKKKSDIVYVGLVKDAIKDENAAIILYRGIITFR